MEKKRGGQPKDPEKHYVPLSARITPGQRSFLESDSILNISRFVREALHLHTMFSAWRGVANEYERTLFEKMLDFVAHDDEALEIIEISKEVEMKTKEGEEITVYGADEFFLDGIKKMAPALLKDIAKNAMVVSKCSFEKSFKYVDKLSKGIWKFKVGETEYRIRTWGHPIELLIVASYLLNMLRTIVVELEEGKEE